MNDEDRVNEIRSEIADIIAQCLKTNEPVLIAWAEKMMKMITPTNQFGADRGTGDGTGNRDVKNQESQEAASQAGRARRS